MHERHATQGYSMRHKSTIGLPSPESASNRVAQVSSRLMAHEGWGAQPPMVSLKDSKSQPACGEELWRDGTMMAGHDGRT